MAKIAKAPQLYRLEFDIEKSVHKKMKNKQEFIKVISTVYVFTTDGRYFTDRHRVANKCDLNAGPMPDAYKIEVSIESACIFVWLIYID